jgi:hypothetical protein
MPVLSPTPDARSADCAANAAAMRALVAEEGIPVHIANDLAWVRFLQSTWSQLEDHQWRQQHPA